MHPITLQTVATQHPVCMGQMDTVLGPLTPPDLQGQTRHDGLPTQGWSWEAFSSKNIRSPYDRQQKSGCGGVLYALSIHVMSHLLIGILELKIIRLSLQCWTLQFVRAFDDNPVGQCLGLYRPSKGVPEFIPEGRRPDHFLSRATCFGPVHITGMENWQVDFLSCQCLDLAELALYLKVFQALCTKRGCWIWIFWHIDSATTGPLQWMLCWNCGISSLSYFGFFFFFHCRHSHVCSAESRWRTLRLFS